MDSYIYANLLGRRADVVCDVFLTGVDMMITYFVEYLDKSSEYIDAYGYERDGSRVTFDIGRGNTIICLNVKFVDGCGW